MSSEFRSQTCASIRMMDNSDFHPWLDPKLGPYEFITILNFWRKSASKNLMKKQLHTLNPNSGKKSTTDDHEKCYHYSYDANPIARRIPEETQTVLQTHVVFTRLIANNQPIYPSRCHQKASS